MCIKSLNKLRHDWKSFFLNVHNIGQEMKIRLDVFETFTMKFVINSIHKMVKPYLLTILCKCLFWKCFINI